MNSFRVACVGIRDSLRCERNMRVHLCIAGYVVLFGVLARLEAWAWAACLVCIGLVMAAELFNTSIEHLCDFITVERKELIRLVKDIAAGGVLIAAIVAVAVGFIVFLREGPLDRFLALVETNPWILCVPILLLIPCLLFIKGRRMMDHKGEL